LNFDASNEISINLWVFNDKGDLDVKVGPRWRRADFQVLRQPHDLRGPLPAELDTPAGLRPYFTLAPCLTGMES
jgi:hypothetical protein